MNRRYIELGCAVLAATVFVAIAGVGRAETLLFTDTFNNANHATSYADYGINQELTSRQSGTYANTAYTVARMGGGVPVDSCQQVDDGRLSAMYGGVVSPNHNFNGADAVGGLKVGFDILADTYWAGLSVGTDSYNTSHIPNPGVIFQFIAYRSPWGTYYDGRMNVYVDGNTASFPTALYTDSATMRHMDLVFNDLVDGSPFNGNGNLDVKAYLDGSATPFLEFTLAKDFSNNYLSLVSDVNVAAGHYDNLSVSNIAVPEPASLVLLAYALVGLLAYARKKRR